MNVPHALVSFILGTLLLGMSGESDVDTVADTPVIDAPVENTTATDSTPVEVAKVPPTVEEVAVVETPVAADAPIEVERNVLPDFGITSDEFVRNYNAVISEADKNMIINSIDDGQSVTYAPMPSNASMGGVIADNGNLRGLIITIGGSEDKADNLRVMAVMLAASNGVQGRVAKEEISQGVMNIFSESIKHEGKGQSYTYGDAKYVANFMPNLGGVVFTIDAVE